MIYPPSRGSLTTTQKTISKSNNRLTELVNQRVMEKRMLAESNFSKNSDESKKNTSLVSAVKKFNHLATAQIISISIHH